MGLCPGEDKDLLPGASISTTLTVERKVPLLPGAQLVSPTKFKHLRGTVGSPRKSALSGFWELPGQSSSLAAKTLAIKA